MRLFSSTDREWTELARYLSGELSPEAKAEFEQTAAADPEVAARLAQAREVWKMSGQSRDGWNGAGALERIHRQGASSPVLRFSHSLRPEPLIRVGVAASIALVSLAAGWQLTRMARQHEAARQENEPPPMAELATVPGQRADLLLPDGSRVILGMASRLRYPVRYAGNARDLYLDGEAYFQVVPDSAKPFRVHTRLGVTEDLSTAFNVRAYGGGQLSVVVAEGAVVLRSDQGTADEPRSDSLILGAADLGRVGLDGKLSLRRGVNVDSYLAWREDRLVFRKTPLAEVLESLRAWDGIEVELGDPTLTDSLTATFRKGESSERVLEVMAVSLAIRYEHRGDLTLVYRRSNPQVRDR